MMVNLGPLIIGAVVSTAVARSMDDKPEESGEEPTVDTQGRQMNENESLQELLAIKKRQSPTTRSIDAYAGETITVPAGGSATVTVGPEQGFDLRVKKVYFDRRTDHTYTHRAGGTPLSNNHQVSLRSTRRVQFGGSVVSVVNNDSGSDSELDFEFEGWSIPVDE